ncbi:Pycsar system effector family protein [Streptomyces sp. NPDC053813]|uniref:Pycsar system effector family protein n=1 Tax=Streptomyces sp. NPDC053813 TaxID=3365717 RepID=UPI0037CE45AE
MSDIDTRISAATATVHAEISRTDGKSGILLSAFGLPLAVLVAVIPGRALTGWSEALVAIGAIGLFISMLIVLVVISPRIDGSPRGSFLHWARCTPESLIEDLNSPTDRAAHLIHLSRIAKRKFLGLFIAGVLIGASLIVLAAALITSLM